MSANVNRAPPAACRHRRTAQGSAPWRQGSQRIWSASLDRLPPFASPVAGLAEVDAPVQHGGAGVGDARPDVVGDLVDSGVVAGELALVPLLLRSLLRLEVG